MRKLLALVLVAVAAIAVPAFAASSKWKATLNGKSEVPKTTSKATGAATFTVASNGKSIKYTLKASGLSGGAQAAHIHFGKAGKAGPVIVNICAKPCSLPKSGTLTSKQFAKAPGVANFAAAIKAIKAGNTYVNIHTKKDPAGEIRGQLKKG
jgi:CHRD domain-containing protein